MTQEQKSKWIEALKSGNYRQGRSYLKTYNAENLPEYCCLGVFAEAVAEIDLDEPTHGGSSRAGARAFSYDERMPDVILGSCPTARELAEMNDGSTRDPYNIRLPMPFTEIADWIEENISVSE